MNLQTSSNIVYNTTNTYKETATTVVAELIESPKEVQVGIYSSLTNGFSTAVVFSSQLMGETLGLLLPGSFSLWGSPLYESPQALDPNFVVGSNKDNCELCQVAFGYVRPRPHHCRKCNRCCCWLCSIYILEGHRSCHDCYIAFRKENQNISNQNTLDVRISDLFSQNSWKLVQQLLDKKYIAQGITPRIQLIYCLGIWYRDGCFGIPINKSRSLDLFLLGSIQKHPDATFELGAMYVHEPEYIVLQARLDEEFSKEKVVETGHNHLRTSAELGSDKAYTEVFVFSTNVCNTINTILDKLYTLCDFIVPFHDKVKMLKLHFSTKGAEGMSFRQEIHAFFTAIEKTTNELNNINELKELLVRKKSYELAQTKLLYIEHVSPPTEQSTFKSLFTKLNPDIYRDHLKNRHQKMDDLSTILSQHWPALSEKVMTMTQDKLLDETFCEETIQEFRNLLSLIEDYKLRANSSFFEMTEADLQENNKAIENNLTQSKNLEDSIKSLFDSTTERT